MLRFWAFLLFLCAFKWSASQSIVNYSEKDGLPSNHVYKITQDVDGFIWIATNEGVVKFNGSEFKIFTTRDGLPTNDVWNLFPAKDGKMWYAAKSKSLGYILKDKVYNFPSKDGHIMSPTNANFDGIEMEAVDSEYAYRLNNSVWKRIAVDTNYLFSIPLLNSDAQFLYQNYKENFIITTRDNNKYELKNSIFSNASYHRGQVTDSLYFNFSWDDYQVINLKSRKLFQFTYEQQFGIQKSIMTRINLVNDQIQITGKNFLGIIGNDLSVKEKYLIPPYLSSHNSLLDKDKNIWAATMASGVYKYNIADLEIKKELSNYKIKDIKNINGEIYAIVNNKGFYKYNTVATKFEMEYEMPAFLYDMSYVSQNNTRYFLNELNITSNQNNKREQLTFEYSNERARSLTFFNGLLYGNNTSGVASLRPENLEVVQTYYQYGVNCTIVFKEKLIIGTSSGLKILKDGLITEIDSSNKIFSYPINGVTVINEDQLLLTTDGYGAYVTDLKEINILPESDFLTSDNAYFKNNELFLPTNDGVYFYQLKIDEFILEKKWNKTNGLPTNKINGVEKVGDVLLIATNQGVIHFPINYHAPTDVINLYIENAVFQGVEINNGSKQKYQDNNTLAVTVKSIDYRPNGSLYYEFRLLPIQKEWTTTTSGNLTFSDLSPDQYTLELRRGEMVECFDLQILARWYQSWIFYLAVTLFIVALVIYVTKYLIGKQQTKRNEELKRSQKFSELQLKALRSQMNPHFVFNSLAAIQYYINENDIETSDTYLVKFSRLIREFFEMSKEQYISINREINLLSNYLSLEQLRFKGKLNYIFEIDPDLDRTDTLPSMLLQPIVENAVNHGIFHKETAGTIIVKFTRINLSEIEICIKDNGKGNLEKKQDHRFKSNAVLEDRIKYLRESGNWEITIKRSDAFPDKKDKGHQVVFRLKKLKNEDV